MTWKNLWLAIRGISVVKSTHQWGSGVEGLWWASIHMVPSTVSGFLSAVLMAYNGAARTAAFHWFFFSFLFFHSFILFLTSVWWGVREMPHNTILGLHLSSLLVGLFFFRIWLYHWVPPFYVSSLVGQRILIRMEEEEEEEDTSKGAHLRSRDNVRSLNGLWTGADHLVFWWRGTDRCCCCCRGGIFAAAQRIRRNRSDPLD